MVIEGLKPPKTRDSETWEKKFMIKVLQDFRDFYDNSTIYDSQIEDFVESYKINRRKRSSMKGITKNPLYKVRNSMINRCYDTKVDCYYRYGGRGIKVCDEWLNNPDAFIIYCESIGYKKGLHLDRINNDGNYEPGNVRFVTPKENSRNTRRNVHITIGGETKVLEDWCQFYNMPSNVICSRLKNGWDIEKAFGTPVFERGDGLNRKLLSMEEAAKIREEYKNGGIFQWQLGEKYGVAKSVINGILTNKHKRYKI